MSAFHDGKVTQGYIPTFSVIIPSFNQGLYIEETLQSLIQQDYPKLEIIVMDGGSTDHTLDIIKKYEKHIHLWLSETDRGQSHAINKGLEVASGDYIAFLNSDDCFLPGYLNNMSYHLAKANKKIDFVFADHGLIGPDKEKAYNLHSRKIGKFKTVDLLKFFYSVDYIIPSQSVFMSRELVDQVGKFNEHLHYCMDLDYYVRCSLHKPHYLLIKEPSYFYRINENTKTSRYKEKMYEEAIAMVSQYKGSLSPLEIWQINRLLAYDKKFRKIRQQPLSSVGSTQLLDLFLENPLTAISDTRYLGLWKRNIFF